MLLIKFKILNFLLGIIFIGVLFLFPCIGYGESLVFYELPSESNNIQPKYESCKDVDIPSIVSELGEKESAEPQICSDCSKEEAVNISGRQEEVFKSQLKKRVQGQIEFKIFLTQKIRACIRGDKDWFNQRNLDWSVMRGICKRENEELKSSIKERWSEMRIQLALSSAMRGDRILSDSTTWMDTTPSHSVFNFNDLPELTDQEKAKAMEIYVETLADTPLQKFDSSEFKERLYGGKPLYFPFSGERYLTVSDQRRLAEVRRNLKKEAKDSYDQIMSEMIVLGYLKTKEPDDKELDEAFGKIEGWLKEFLVSAKAPEVDMGFLLSFEPLVEGLLSDDSGYCFAAERARVKAERNESLKNWMMIGAGFIAAVPCFSTGPVGASACIAAGTALGVVGYKQAELASEESFGRVLTGKQFETIAEFKEKEREELLAMLLVPMGVFGITAKGGRALVGAAKRVVGATKGLGRGVKSIGKGIESYRETLVRSAKFSLGAEDLSPRQIEAIEVANRIGQGKGGKGGLYLGVNTWTVPLS